MRISLVLGADATHYAHDLAAALGPDDELTVIAPTVRGHFSAGLSASPDLDALLALGTTPPTYSVADSLEAIGYIPRWQRASDQVISARVVRTDLILNGASLTEATIAAASRAELPYRLLPVRDDRAEFRAVVGPEDEPHAIHIDEYLLDPTAHDVTQLLLVAEKSLISPSASQALLESDVLVLGPSSRTLSIDPVLRTPGFLDLIADDFPVLVVEPKETAPVDLVRVAGLREADPGAAESVGADPSAVAQRAGQLAAR